MDSALTIDEVLARFRTDRTGFKSDVFSGMRETYGWNELPEKKKSWALLVLRQFQDVLVYILIGALVLTFVLRVMSGDTSIANSIDIIAIFAILILNAALGFIQEYRSEQALSGLRALTSPMARVRRGGVESMIPSRDLLPGDIVLLETGDKVSADGRLIAVSHLSVNESSLTGESEAVAKTADALTSSAASLGGQRNMVFGGTLVAGGSGEYVVTATGVYSQIGRIAMLVSASEPPPTPLERRMKSMSGVMAVVVLLLCALLAIVEWSRGEPVIDIVLLCVSLAVSAVPEGLPAVVTACLAMGVRRMAQLHALVMRLDSLETLGSITVICSDKTGTITENNMTVQETWTMSGTSDDEKLLVQIGASCNRASLPDLGDPTEIGLLRYAQGRAIGRLAFDEEEIPFTSEARFMRTRHGSVSFLKGAPEAIYKLCDAFDDTAARAQSSTLATRGLRVLAMAVSEKGHTRLVGLIGMEDPPRIEVLTAMQEARTAGIRTVMITGDHADTALSIAHQVGIDGDAIDGQTLDTLTGDELARTVRQVSVFARVSPEHKIAILRALQDQGHVVAMTGDGVNDAPALKAADVGIAMGKNGTQVAREAASLVLTDDNYATIVVAIREGRRIYDNIRKFILYLVRANVGQILLFSLTVGCNLPLPLLPIHILWINLMTDGLPALALGMEEAEPGIMRRKPRPADEQIFSGVWLHLLVASLTSCLLTFGLFFFMLRTGADIIHARTIAFTFSIFFEILLAFHSRTNNAVWTIGIFSNTWLNASALLPFLLQILLVYSPLHSVFQLMPLSFADLLMLTLTGIIGFLALEITKPLFHRSEHPQMLPASASR